MNIEQMKLADLKPYEGNAKKHDETQIKNVMQSIKEYGIVQPLVVDKDNVLIIGHCRLIAAKRLKLKEVPVVRLEDLSEEEAQKLRLLDNKLNESEWDFDLLADQIPELDFSGFDIDWGLPEDEEDNKDIIEDEPPAPPEVAFSQLGDLWLLGDHRLLCGDSCNLDDVQRLMDGKLADCVITDPPYNMGYEGAGNSKDRASKRIKNDSMSSEQFRKFLHDAYVSFYSAMRDGASIYVFYKELGEGVFIEQMAGAGLNFKQELIWVKNQLVLGGSKYQSMYEPCLMACKGKSIKIWNGGRKQRSVIESIDFMTEDELRETIKELMAEEDPDIIRERKQLVNDLHPTMKPIRLLAKFVENSSNKGNVILDLFGGSGSTMIAAQQLGRKCYLNELDEKFVDVIVQRYINFVGHSDDVFLIRNGEKVAYKDLDMEVANG